MTHYKHFTGCLAAFALLMACHSQPKQPEGNVTGTKADTVATETQSVPLPEPYATKSVRNFSEVVGWSGGQMPQAPAGFVVSKYADSLNNPRWIYQGPNGDVFVAQASTEAGAIKQLGSKLSGKGKSQNLGNSANDILLFRDTNKDGRPDSALIFLEGLNRPFGMLVLNGWFYVANTDGLWRYPYRDGQTRITGKGQKILDLPAGGYNNHWTRNIVANAAGTKIYVTVGSGSNVAEHGLNNEVRRANILEINPDGSGERVYASGLRNPVGLAWAPGTNTLWAAVNERDELGDQLVPDYLTSVKEGGFYGWPFSYFGQHKDPRMNGQGADMVAKAIVPDVPLGSHTASLGLAFYNQSAFPARYRNGAFIGQHGSWNSSTLVGYRVAFVSFANGKPVGKPEDFLTGFIADTSSAHPKVYGRPVGVAVLSDGAMLVADDASNTIWRVAVKP